MIKLLYTPLRADQYSARKHSINNGGQPSYRNSISRPFKFQRDRTHTSTCRKGGTVSAQIEPKQRKRPISKVLQLYVYIGVSGGQAQRLQQRYVRLCFRPGPGIDPDRFVNIRVQFQTDATQVIGLKTSTAP